MFTDSVFHFLKKFWIPLLFEVIHFGCWIEHYSEMLANAEVIKGHNIPMAMICASEAPER